MQDSRLPLTDDDLSTLLRSIDRAPPVVNIDHIIARARQRHSRRNILIAAAAILATATAAAATVPGLLMHTLGHHAEVNREIRPHSPAQLPLVAGSARGIAFAPERGVRIAFATAQTTGTVRIQSTDDSSLRITQTSSNREAQFGLTPDGVSVDNSGSTSSYEISIPATLRDAEVRIAQRIVYVKNGAHRLCSGSDDPKHNCTIAMKHGGVVSNASP
jgi:hypothetical protein